MNTTKKYLNLLVVFASIFILGFCNLLYTNHVQKQTEEKFCTVVNDAVATYHAYPAPITPLGVQLKEDYIALEGKLGCMTS